MQTSQVLSGLCSQGTPCTYTRCNTSRTKGIAEILWNNPNYNGFGQTSETFLVVFGANSFTIKLKLTREGCIK